MPFNVSRANLGKYEGFFRIAQVLPFVKYAYRLVLDEQLPEMLKAFSVDGKVMDLLPIFKKTGGLLTAMHKVEQKVAKANNYSYPIIPPLKVMNRLMSSSHRLTSALAGLNASSPFYQLVRFITASAMLGNDSDELKTHEQEYNILVKNYPETYSPFRERNPTYQLMLSVVNKNDPFFLARLMLRRIYAWGLDVHRRGTTGA